MMNTSYALSPALGARSKIGGSNERQDDLSVEEGKARQDARNACVEAAVDGTDTVVDSNDIKQRNTSGCVKVGFFK